MTEKSIKPHESNVRTIMKTVQLDTVWKCISHIPTENTVFMLLMKTGTFSNGAKPPLPPPPPPQVKSPCCWTAPGQPPSSLGVPSNAWSWTGSALSACWDCAQRSWRGTSRDTTASSPSQCDTLAPPSGRRRSQHPRFRWEEVWNQGKGHQFNISPHFRAFFPLPFCKSPFFFDGVPFELCCHVALCKNNNRSPPDSDHRSFNCKWDVCGASAVSDACL